MPASTVVRYWRAVLISLSCLLLSCLPRAGTRTSSTSREETLRYLALGDSYTIGEGVAVADRWPVQLARLLRERSVEIAEPEIIARTRWTTADLAAAMDEVAPRGPYALATLLIGVNNQYRGGSLEEYRAGFTALLERAIALAGREPGRVVVLSIPDWGATPFAAGRDPAAIAADIDRFNAVNREETLRRGARYVDVTAISRAVSADATRLAPDGLHPSGVTYAEWARLALPEAMAALGARR